VNYEPNSLAGGCPFQAGAAGFSSFAERLLQASREADPIKLRIKPEKFAEHYAQAALFFNSQTPIEQQHIIDAFRFELTRVQTEAVRERMVSQLMNVDERLALGVASGLGMALPEPAPAAAPRPEVEVQRSQGLSLLARPGNGSVATRRIALLVADGMDTAAASALYGRLSDAGALPRYIGRRLGKIQPDSGDPIPVEVTFEAAPSVLWDAVVLPSGEAAADQLALDDHVQEFVMQQWRHNKPMLVPHTAEVILHTAGVDIDLDVDMMGEDEAEADVPLDSPEVIGADDAVGGEIAPADAQMRVHEYEAAPGLLLVPDGDLAGSVEAFITLVAMHRSFTRFNGNAMEAPAPDLPEEGGADAGRRITTADQ
jgi:hypothetical protein